MYARNEEKVDRERAEAGKERKVNMCMWSPERKLRRTAYMWRSLWKKRRTAWHAEAAVYEEKFSSLN